VKKLWIISAGVEAVPGIIKAKKMGLHVIVSDGDPKAPGFVFADESVIASTYDIKETLNAVESYVNLKGPIDGVLSVSSDVPKTVASISSKLNLNGISIETAHLSSDKVAMKERLLNKGINIPWFSRINNLEHLFQIAQEKGFPLVIKPTDSRGARGVLRLTDVVDLEWAFRESIKCSPAGKVMAEEYVEGKQISTEALLINGAGYTFGFCDRNYEFIDRFAPYIIENGGTQPSLLSENDRHTVSKLATEAGLALGVKTGVVKGDMVLSKDGPKVIEVAPRLSGGWFSTDQIPLHTGVDFVGCAIKLALGENIPPEDLTPKYKRGVAIRYFFPPIGYVEKIPDIEAIRSMPSVYKAVLFVSPGEVVEPVTDHTKRAGFVITVGNTRQEAIHYAVKAVNAAESGIIIRRP
jgi:biotin carboxylase